MRLAFSKGSCDKFAVKIISKKKFSTGGKHAVVRNISYGPRCEKTCLQGFANNKCADQPVHLRRLISAFVIRFLEITISRLATSKISTFSLISVAVETGLKFTLWKYRRQVFSLWVHMMLCLGVV